MISTREPGRAWSTFGFAIGVIASIAANIAHARVAPVHAAANWQPQGGAIVAAAFWPTALVISIEVISRVRWPQGAFWWLVRYVGLMTVALIAAVISYGHLSALLRFYGEDRLSATIGPLAVDGLMVVCSAALLAIGDNVRQRQAVTVAEVAEIDAKTEPDSTAVQVTAPVTRPLGRKATTTAAKVKETAAKIPNATPAMVAATVGTSETTARRYLRDRQPQDVLV